MGRPLGISRQEGGLNRMPAAIFSCAIPAQPAGHQTKSGRFKKSYGLVVAFVATAVVGTVVTFPAGIVVAAVVGFVVAVVGGFKSA